MTRILCAAVWVDVGGQNVPHQPANVKQGMVICGHRHHNCLAIVAMAWPGNRIPQEHQGFLTSDNRFVDRQEAWEIAKAAGQLAPERDRGALYSEDLY